MSKRFQGFTLVEIMIVVAIIAILAAVAIPNFLKYRSDARTQACVNNMKQLQTAAESWRTTQTDATAVPQLSDLVGTDPKYYIRKDSSTFKCPDGGTYSIEAEGATEESHSGPIKVTCSLGGTHALP